MKKAFIGVFAALLLITFSGCDNKAESSDNSSGEYIFEHCSMITAKGVELSVPCTCEELSELFATEPFGQKVEFKADGFYVQPYKMLTKDGEYIGLVSFAYFYGGGNVLWSLESAYNKNAEMSVIMGGIELGKTLRSEIEARLGDGDDPLGNGDYAAYYFEDGSLSIVYSEDTVVSFNAWFDSLKTAL